MTNIPALLPQFYIGNVLSVYYLNFMNQSIFRMNLPRTICPCHNVQIGAFVFVRVRQDTPPREGLIAKNWNKLAAVH